MLLRKSRGINFFNSCQEQNITYTIRFMSIFYITILYKAENIVEIHKLIDISILKVLVGVIPKKGL